MPHRASAVWGHTSQPTEPHLSPSRPALLSLPSAPAQQMAVPQLQSPTAQRAFNLELANADYDLKQWRETTRAGRSWDFTLLDRAGGAGASRAWEKGTRAGASTSQCQRMAAAWRGKGLGATQGASRLPARCTAFNA